nr:hypothetical protein [Pseudomonas sp. Hg5Tf]MDH2558472.1 hypothetical protein [Pseudomonas sp. Hg5Tf]
MSQTTKYVIKYKLDGEQRFDFAQMNSDAPQQCKPPWKNSTAKMRKRSPTSR